jgi:hypothetical protein
VERANHITLKVKPT